VKGKSPKIPPLPKGGIFSEKIEPLLGDFQKKLYRCLSLSKAITITAFDKLRQHFGKLSASDSWYFHFGKSPKLHCRATFRFKGTY
jgi:hypothetical protein